MKKKKKKMTVTQQEQFKDTANKLLACTFLSRDKKDNKEAYYFLMSYKEVFDEFFQILGYEITLDMPTGSVMLSGASASNTLKLSASSSYSPCKKTTALTSFRLSIILITLAFTC